MLLGKRLKVVLLAMRLKYVPLKTELGACGARNGAQGMWRLTGISSNGDKIARKDDCT